VVFGTVYKKFEEANWLVDNGGGFSIYSFDGLQERLTQLEEENFYHKASEKAKKYIQENQGATEAVIRFIQKRAYLK